MIKKGIFTRKHSVDLLDGLDLDFLNVDSHTSTGLPTSFDGDFNFDHHFNDDIDMSLNLFGHDDGMGMMEHEHPDTLLTDRSFDRDWFMRRMSIGSLEGSRLRSGTTDWQMQAQGLLLNDTDRIAADILSSDWGAGPMGGMGGVVDMSAYEAVAANLQGNTLNSNDGDKPAQVLRLNKVNSAVCDTDRAVLILFILAAAG
jgi:hypothetical protein